MGVKCRLYTPQSQAAEPLLNLALDDERRARTAADIGIADIPDLTGKSGELD